MSGDCSTFNVGFVEERSEETSEEMWRGERCCCWRRRFSKGQRRERLCCDLVDMDMIEINPKLQDSLNLFPSPSPSPEEE